MPYSNDFQTCLLVDANSVQNSTYEMLNVVKAVFYTANEETS